MKNSITELDNEVTGLFKEYRDLTHLVMDFDKDGNVVYSFNDMYRANRLSVLSKIQRAIYDLGIKLKLYVSLYARFDIIAKQHFLEDDLAMKALDRYARLNNFEKLLYRKFSTYDNILTLSEKEIWEFLKTKPTSKGFKMPDVKPIINYVLGKTEEIPECPDQLEEYGIELISTNSINDLEEYVNNYILSRVNKFKVEGVDVKKVRSHKKFDEIEKTPTHKRLARLDKMNDKTFSDNYYIYMKQVEEIRSLTSKELDNLDIYTFESSSLHEEYEELYTALNDEGLMLPTLKDNIVLADYVMNDEEKKKLKNSAIYKKCKKIDPESLYMMVANGTFTSESEVRAVVLILQEFNEMSLEEVTSKKQVFDEYVGDVALKVESIKKTVQPKNKKRKTKKK